MEALTMEQTAHLLEAHRKYMKSGKTFPYEFRLDQLRKLAEAIKRHEPALSAALREDLGKSEFESYTTEIGFVLDSIRRTMKQLKRWMKPQKVGTPFYHLASHSRVYREPYGTVLIIGPFNYPFQLLIEPLIGAIAAGNCVVLKPSEHAPAVAEAVRAIIGECFEEDYVRIVLGGADTTSALIHSPFDYIFFTGSVPVGKIVMQAAAPNLVPVTLELGGKSPAIVDESANIDVAAKRLVWGKLMNTGQTCVAPDYILAHHSIRTKLLDALKSAIAAFYGPDPQQSGDYGRIVNERHFDRLSSFLERERGNIIVGGKTDRDDLYIEPTLLAARSWSDAAMEDELFGPILPVLSYERLEEAIESINARPKPLALYLFTEREQVKKEVLRRVSFGGGCVNDTISHLANPNLPFGGVGGSGIGAYHGWHSYDLFSHRKSVMEKSTKITMDLLFPPYKEKLKWIKKVLR